MPNNELIKLLPIFLFLSFLTISSFLNYISALYSEADLFKVDLTKGRKTTKIKKLLFVLKSGQMLSATISFWQIFLNLSMSYLITKMISENEKFLKKLWVGEGFIFFLASLFIAFFTEILTRFLATKNLSKRFITNHFLINTAYSLSRLSPFQLIIKPKKRVFVNSEKDVSLFVSNLAAEAILEKKEANLIKAALNFDEMKVSQVFKKWEKVICLEKSISYKKLQKTYLNHPFDRYPIINKKKQLVGTFSMKIFSRALLKNKNAVWQDYIDKEFITVQTQEKINKVFEKLQKKYRHLAIVKSNKNIIGIITLQDILNTLVGKMKDEKDKLKSLINSSS
jgi:putative hemolysin